MPLAVALAQAGILVALLEVLQLRVGELSSESALSTASGWLPPGRATASGTGWRATNLKAGGGALTAPPGLQVGPFSVSRALAYYCKGWRSCAVS